ncbi:MAG: AI-2E family transporter [Gammaproteobacteria bacterium]|nr:AI-2E family transporter [Gammaproteobacteria bacterium]
MTTENPSEHKIQSALLTTAAFIIVIAGIKTAEAIIVPFLLSIFIAIIFTPLLFWLKNKNIPSPVALIIILSGLLVFGAVTGAIIGGSIQDFTQNTAEYKQQLRALTNTTLVWLNAQGISIDKTSFLQQFDPGSVMQLASTLLGGLGGMLTNTFLIIATVLFILAEASGFETKLRIAFNKPIDTFNQMDLFLNNVKQYMVIKTIMSLLTAGIISIGLFMQGLDYPLLWGLLIFLFNYIPNIGSIIAAVPAVLLAMIQLSPSAALITASIYIVVNIVIGNIIEPRYMGKGLGVSALIVFLSLIFWGWVLGPVGLFLSVPLTIMVKIALDSQKKTRWIAVLLGPSDASSATK